MHGSYMLRGSSDHIWRFSCEELYAVESYIKGRLTLDTLRVTIMIKSFSHKGLKDFYYKGSKKGINPEHASRLARMLDRLDVSLAPKDMDLPGYDLHPLKGDKKDMWSVTVSGNWRMTFYFWGQDAYLVNYLDYH